MNKKEIVLTGRGIRMSDEQWKKIVRISKKKDCTPSILIRGMIDRLKEDK